MTVLKQKRRELQPHNNNKQKKINRKDGKYIKDDVLEQSRFFFF